ncbi:MAG: PcfJ domain-containing protein [Kiritimatiellae bacterium]|nr:PcfJ domain-containing protein [Kiritimatiellia bacterium]
MQTQRGSFTDEFVVPRVTGAVFKPETNKLYLFRDTKVVVCTCGEDGRHPHAWRKTRDEPRWRGCRPDLSLSDMQPRLPKKLLAHTKDGWPCMAEELPMQLEFDFTWSSRRRAWAAQRLKSAEAVRRFFDRVPPDIRAAMGTYSAGQWCVYAFLARVPGSFDLFHSNPMLAFCLAQNWRFHRPAVSRPLRAARGLVRRKQRDILGWLGFPATESVAKITRKVAPDAIEDRLCFYLRKALRDPQATRFFQHIPRINAEVLRLVSDPRTRPHVSQSLLEDALKRQRRPQRSELLCLLWDTLRMMPLVQPRWRRKVFVSVEDVADCHDQLVNLMHSEHRTKTMTYEFPAPPVPGLSTDQLRVEPVVSPRGLIAEGRSQRNCVASYACDVAHAHTFIYAVHAPERATLSIVPDHRGGWRIGDLRARLNEPVQHSTYGLVRAWLEAAAPPPVPAGPVVDPPDDDLPF